MRDKGVILGALNARAIKSAVFSTICRLRPLREYFNYYQDAECFEDAAEKGSIRSLVIDPVQDYGLNFSDAELKDIMRGDRAEVEGLRLTFKVARLRDVTILGSAGVTVSNESGKAMFLSRDRTKLPRNWVVGRPLRGVPADPGSACINLLGVRKGHRHFAHFFWDMMVPLMVYLKHWRDPAEAVTVLVREDLSPIQRDAFRFIGLDYPGVTFRTLRANEKMHCADSIYIAYQNANHGKDNALARDALTDIRDLFVKHYGIAPPKPGKGKRVYISRNDAAIRRVKNEKEVDESLARRGFETFQPGRMPFRDQVALFHSADIIVSPHGAGLANLMFCRPGTRMLEIFPSNFIDEGFLKLAKAMELKYDYLIAGDGDFKQDFTIDPAMPGERLEDCGSDQAGGSLCIRDRDDAVPESN